MRVPPVASAARGMRCLPGGFGHERDAAVRREGGTGCCETGLRSPSGRPGPAAVAVGVVDHRLGVLAAGGASVPPATAGATSVSPVSQVLVPSRCPSWSAGVTAPRASFGSPQVTAARRGRKTGFTVPVTATTARKCGRAEAGPRSRRRGRAARMDPWRSAGLPAGCRILSRRKGSPVEHRTPASWGCGVLRHAAATRGEGPATEGPMATDPPDRGASASRAGRKPGHRGRKTGGMVAGGRRDASASRGRLDGLPRCPRVLWRHAFL
jgi:hypothetical protein